MRNEGLGSWPQRRARIAPGDTALVHEDTRFTYGEVSERVTRLAQALRGMGVRSRDRIAYLGVNHPAFVETMFACTNLGAIFVPLNTRLAAPELAYMIDDAAVRVLVWATEFEEVVSRILAEVSVPDLVVVGGRAGESAQAYERLVTEASSEPLDVAVTHDDVAMIMYTSGTTGTPKGVTLTHGNLAWNCFNVLIDVDVANDEVTLVSAPLFHTAALNQTFLPTFVKGGTSVLVSAFDPQRTLELISEHRITWMFGVPAMFQALTQAPGWADADLSTVRAVEAGGAPVPEELIRTFQARGITFMQGYGMTEASPGVLFLRAADSLRKVGSAGTPCFFTDIQVVTLDGSPARPGEAGEILVQGPNLMRGYWNKPEETRRAITDVGWFRSGDVAVRDDEGYLFIVDRMKDMYISGGENVYPAEIENVLYEHPSVAECAVIGVPDERWGEVGRAFVVLRDGEEFSEQQMRDFLESRLARYKLPTSLVVVDTLPRNASGKLLKRRLGDDATT
jgi:fatty-acyl-CoA synthase